jgi:hypothetical protein
VVDGDLEEWAGWESELRKGSARVAAANDAEALYLALETSDPTLAPLFAHRGLTVWFDPTGGEAHTLGVRFPLPSTAPPGRWGERRGSPVAARLDKLELLGPEPFTRRELPAPGAEGVRVAFASSPGRASYEIRVPLGGGTGWGLGAAVRPGGTLGIGLEAKGYGEHPQGGFRRGRGPGGSAPPYGSAQEPPIGGPTAGGPRSDEGPGGGFGRGSRRPPAARDFEAWVRVILASGASH